MENVFVYGSLRNLQKRSDILGRKVKAATDVLDGYTLVDHSYFKVYPTIKKDESEMVIGEIFEASDEDLMKLDHYETENYERIKVKLASGNEAITYIETSTKFI